MIKFILAGLYLNLIRPYEVANKPQSIQINDKIDDELDWLVVEQFKDFKKDWKISNKLFHQTIGQIDKGIVFINKKLLALNDSKLKEKQRLKLKMAKKR